MMDFSEWWRSTVKGQIVACVRGRAGSDRVARYIDTAVRRQRLTRHDVERLLREVERESVRPFMGPPWSQPERQSRLDALIASLRHEQMRAMTMRRSSCGD
jgi:hypothetical protein